MGFGFSLNYFALDAALPLKRTALFATYCLLPPETANNINVLSLSCLLSKLQNKGVPKLVYIYL